MFNLTLHLFHFAASSCGTKTGALPSLYDKLPCAPDAQGTPTPGIQSIQDVALMVGNVVRILIAISGSLAVILLLVAAIYYITATGDPGRIKRAKEIIIQTVTGLVVIIMAYAVITYITVGF